MVRNVLGWWKTLSNPVTYWVENSARVGDMLSCPGSACQQTFLENERLDASPFNGMTPRGDCAYIIRSVRRGRIVDSIVSLGYLFRTSQQWNFWHHWHKINWLDETAKTYNIGHELWIVLKQCFRPDSDTISCGNPMCLRGCITCPQSGCTSVSLFVKKRKSYLVFKPKTGISYMFTA